MKILVLSDYFSAKSLGGAGIVSYDLVNALKNKGHEVFVITTTTKKEDVGKNTYNGIIEYTLYSNYITKFRSYLSLYNPTVVRKIESIITEVKPDIIQAFNIHTYISYAALKVAKKSGAKVFITMHDVMAIHHGKMSEFIDRKNFEIPKNINYKINSWQALKTFRFEYNPFRNLVIRYYLKYADKIIAVSYALKKALEDNSIKNITVIHNGIDVNEYQISEEEVTAFKKQFNLENKKIISFAGWTSGAKGGEELLLAMQKIVKQVPDACIFAVGNKDYFYKYMVDSAKEKGLSQNIIFAGWLTGKRLAISYKSCDVVAFPSICLDTFGMVNLEGMVAMKPVVATCFGGAPEIVINNETGYIVHPYNAHDMAEKIVDLLNDKEKALRFGKAGYERAKKYFDSNSKIEELIALYNS